MDDDIIEKVVQEARRLAGDLPLREQSEIYEELRLKFRDMSIDALRDDYLADGLYC